MHPPSIEDVLQGEREQIEDARFWRLHPRYRKDPEEKNLIGLAFSGGGIRSATFNLGVLQAFAKHNLLRAFDYLSTVSGGGYIGGWLMGWMKHGGIGIREIEKQLAPHPYSASSPGDPPPVHFLRNYSNYLTPRKGVLSGDFWAFMGSYLRNTILNLLILLLMLLSLLLVPRAIQYIPHLLEVEEQASWAIRFGSHVVDSQYLALGLGFLLGFWGVTFIGLNLIWVNPPQGRKYPWYSKQGPIQLLIVVPLFVSAGMLSYGYDGLLLWWPFPVSRVWMAPVLGIVLYFGAWMGAFGVCKVVRWIKKIPKQNGVAWWMVLVTALGTGGLCGFLFLPYAHVLQAEWPNRYHWPGDHWHVLAFGTPLLVGIMLLAGVLHIGLMGRRMGDEYREWWGRLGGWLMIYSLSWTSLFLISIYVPVGLGKLWAQSFHYKYTISGIVTWALSTLYGIFFGKSERTGRLHPDDTKTKKILGYLARVTPYIFILGLLTALAVVDLKVVASVAGQPVVLKYPPNDIVDFWTPIFCGLFFLAALLLSRRVDINEFSIHHLYRNRLVRCYLGASAPKREGQPFTGFSCGDDISLSDLKIPPNTTNPQDARPIPILNASLNVSRGQELAMQTRKARSFAFTPAYSGFTRTAKQEQEWESAFAPTELAGNGRRDYKNGSTLGTAIAISGAAASPNMGSYSSPSLAFMMTLFDVRLGWWIGNPLPEQPKERTRRNRITRLYHSMRKRLGASSDQSNCIYRRWKRGGPRLGFGWLLCELFGAASDDSSCVYLSDGGHFENLAIYELVRRGCRLIVASDASRDSEYGFGDLRNAMERCRTDFGVEIEVPDLDQLKSKDKISSRHFVVGKIHYTPGSEENDGVIIYLKPTLQKEDSADLVGYAAVNKKFPHDSTANQWFDETHFENYRALGKIVGLAASGSIAKEVEKLMGRGVLRDEGE